MPPKLWRQCIYITMIPSQNKYNHGCVEIRPMMLADLQQVYDLDRLSFSLPWPPKAFEYELLENPHSLLWVAESESETGSKIIVGAIVIWLILDEAHIATLAVHPEYRSQGIGRQLLVVALIEASSSGAVTATLEVRANNLAAQSLYHQLQFDTVGRRPKYYKDNLEDAILMTLHHLSEEYLCWLENQRWQEVEKVIHSEQQPGVITT